MLSCKDQEPGGGLVMGGSLVEGSVGLLWGCPCAMGPVCAGDPGCKAGSSFALAASSPVLGPAVPQEPRCPLGFATGNCP